MNESHHAQKGRNHRDKGNIRAEYPKSKWVQKRVVSTLWQGIQKLILNIRIC